MLARSKPKRKTKGKRSRPDEIPVPQRAAASAAPAAPPPPLAGPGGTGSQPDQQRIDDVLRAAGISRGDGEAPRAAEPGGPRSPLSIIPKKGQDLLERVFFGAAVVFGTIFLASGVAVSIEATCRILGSPLPDAVDELLTDYVFPLLTPSILALFASTVSLGVLKQLQLDSDSAGVLYSEDD